MLSVDEQRLSAPDSSLSVYAVFHRDTATAAIQLRPVHLNRVNSHRPNDQTLEGVAEVGEFGKHSELRGHLSLALQRRLESGLFGRYAL